MNKFGRFMFEKSSAQLCARWAAVSWTRSIEDNRYKRLLNEDILKQATKSNTPANEIDQVLKLPTKFSMEFFLMDEVFPFLGPVVFGHNDNFRYTMSFLIEFFRF